MAIKTTILTKKDYITSKWSGGETTQLYIYPEDSSYKNIDFKFRISSATIELEESDFTLLDGVYRYITTLENKIKLTHDYKQYIELEPFKIYEFKGDINTHSYGKVVDFNLMLANKAKGTLKTLYLDREKTINVVNKFNEKSYQVFYSHNADVQISVDKEEIGLRKKDLLVIETTEDMEIKISPSDNKDYIIFASIEL